MSAIVQCQYCGKKVYARRSDVLWCPKCRELRAKERFQRYELNQKEPCPDCGQPMTRRAEYCLVCSNRRRGEKRRGENNGYWRGGRTSANGYTLIRVNHCSGAGAYRPEHHIVWEEANGRPLPKGWVIHHLNGIKDDNQIENLMAMPRNSHNPDFLTKPYQERIQELELKLAQQGTAP